MDQKNTKRKIKVAIVNLSYSFLFYLFVIAIVLGTRGLIVGDPMTFVYFFILGGVNFCALLLVRFGKLEKKDQGIYIFGVVGGISIGILFYYIYILGVNSNWG